MSVLARLRHLTSPKCPQSFWLRHLTSPKCPQSFWLRHLTSPKCPQSFSSICPFSHCVTTARAPHAIFMLNTTRVKPSLQHFSSPHSELLHYLLRGLVLQTNSITPFSLFFFFIVRFYYHLLLLLLLVLKYCFVSSFFHCFSFSFFSFSNCLLLLRVLVVATIYSHRNNASLLTLYHRQPSLDSSIRVQNLQACKSRHYFLVIIAMNTNSPAKIPLSYDWGRSISPEKGKAARHQYHTWKMTSQLLPRRERISRRT